MDNADLPPEPDYSLIPLQERCLDKVRPPFVPPLEDLIRTY